MEKYKHELEKSPVAYWNGHDNLRFQWELVDVKKFESQYNIRWNINIENIIIDKLLTFPNLLGIEYILHELREVHTNTVNHCKRYVTQTCQCCLIWIYSVCFRKCLPFIYTHWAHEMSIKRKIFRLLTIFNRANGNQREKQRWR